MLVILLSLMPIALAEIYVDFNCSSWRGADAGFKYDPQAVSCSNSLPDDLCKMLYPNYHIHLAEGGDSHRSMKCYSKTSTPVIDDKEKARAIRYCPKTCGYCCHTKPYQCENRNVLINCATVTNAQCRDPSLRDMLIEECPATCGFCEYATGCIDTSPLCQLSGICDDAEMAPFAIERCPKTCNHCYRTTTTTQTSTFQN